MAPAPAVRVPQRPGRPLRAPLVALVLLLSLAGALPGPLLAPDAAQAAPVTCSDIGGGRWECGFWRPGDGVASGSMVVKDGAIVGYLRPGRHWVTCQARGARVTSGANWNDWYAWTLSDAGANRQSAWGWVSALDAADGGNGEGFGGVPGCDGTQGPAPAHEGAWETVPPAPPSPTPLPPAATPPLPSPVDELLYRAGREVSVDPGGTCTSAFAILIGGRTFGLTAGHCAPQGFGDVASWWSPKRRWTVRRHADRKRVAPADRVDALAFGSRSGLTIGAAPEVHREGLPPLRITGFLPREQQPPGTLACFTGVTSGPDRCGSVYELPPALAGPDGRLLCAAVPVQPGDSGGPVYTGPQGHQAVALGIVHSRSSVNGSDLCYEPIDDVLRGLGAELALTSVPAPRRDARLPLRSVVTGSRAFTPRSGLLVHVRLARRATIVVTVQREGARRGSSETVRIRGKRGANRIRVATVRGRRLAPGRYAGRVVGAIGGRRSLPWPFQFRITTRGGR